VEEGSYTLILGCCH